MTSRPAPTASSSTPARARAISAGSIPRPARTRTFRSARARRRMASSSAPDGAPWITDGGLNANVRFDPEDQEVRLLHAAAAAALRQSQHRRVRQGRRLLVHRPERRARLRQSQDRQARKLEVAAPRHLRHHGDAGERGLVRGARRRPSRQDRQGDRQRRRSSSRTRRAPARAASGRTPRACSGSASGTPARSAATIPAAKTWKTWLLPGNPGSGCYSVYVDEQDKVWLTDFMTNAIVRFDPDDREVRKLPEQPARRAGAPDARPARRGLGRGIRQQPAGAN